MCLLTASVSIVTISMAHAIGIGNSETLVASLIDDIIGGRYFFLPNVLFFFTLLILSRELIVRQSLSGYFLRALLVWVIVVSTYNYSADRQVAENYFSGPSWSKEVSKWTQNTEHSISIWPDGWELRLPASTD